MRKSLLSDLSLFHDNRFQIKNTFGFKSPII